MIKLFLNWNFSFLVILPSILNLSAITLLFLIFTSLLLFFLSRFKGWKLIRLSVNLLSKLIDNWLFFPVETNESASLVLFTNTSHNSFLLLKISSCNINDLQLIKNLLKFHSNLPYQVNMMIINHHFYTSSVMILS